MKKEESSTYDLYLRASIPQKNLTSNQTAVNSTMLIINLRLATTLSMLSNVMMDTRQNHVLVAGAAATILALCGSAWIYLQRSGGKV